MTGQKPRFHGLGTIVAGSLVTVAVLGLAGPIWYPAWHDEIVTGTLLVMLTPFLLALVGLVLLLTAQAKIWGLASRGSLEPPPVRGLVTTGIALVVLGLLGHPVLATLMLLG